MICHDARQYSLACYSLCCSFLFADKSNQIILSFFVPLPIFFLLLFLWRSLEPCYDFTKISYAHYIKKPYLKHIHRWCLVGYFLCVWSPPLVRISDARWQISCFREVFLFFSVLIFPCLILLSHWFLRDLNEPCLSVETYITSLVCWTSSSILTFHFFFLCAFCLEVYNGIQWHQFGRSFLLDIVHFFGL